MLFLILPTGKVPPHTSTSTLPVPVRKAVSGEHRQTRLVTGLLSLLALTLMATVRPLSRSAGTQFGKSPIWLVPNPISVSRLSARMVAALDCLARSIRRQALLAVSLASWPPLVLAMLHSVW